MNRVGVGIAMLSAAFAGAAISDGYTRGDDPAQRRGAKHVILAESGDNPWALPDRRQGGKLPDYITNPKYATEEDRETKLNYGNKERNNNAHPVQQYPPAGYGAPLGLPAVPHVYTPNTGIPYGYQPAYPGYPGMGVMPGLGTPYTGDTGFGGNPYITPYGNIYGTTPYQQTTPPTGK